MYRHTTSMLSVDGINLLDFKPVILGDALKVLNDFSQRAEIVLWLQMPIILLGTSSVKTSNVTFVC